MKRKLITTVIATLIVFSAFGQQFDLSAELRPRYENRHGFKTLLETNAKGSNFVSQRTRLNFGFKNEKLRLKIVMQNVRVWGDVGTLSSDDKASALHEAWAEAIVNTKTSFKLGRQEIVYDDHRIFGNVGWAQQARSHDALLFKYTPNATNKLDIGLALNSDSQSNVDNLYSNAAGYKSLQYAWYHGVFNKLGVSFLLLNTGIEYLDVNNEQTIDYMQTIGPRLTYKSGKFNANAAAYLQTGKSKDSKVKASYFAGNIGYKFTKEWSLGLGVDQLSGTNSNASSTDIKSFAPLFGTNHKFNGFMDYFYVGNHANSVGLRDLNMTLGYSKNKFSAKLIPHLFSAAADVFDGATKMDARLGTEIDFTIGYEIAKDINLNAGFSKMFATETMEVLKGGDKDENNSWAWVMITFKPNLFSHRTN
jgi:hypothetical protein